MTDRNRWYILAALLGAMGVIIHFALATAEAGTLLADIVFLGMVVLVIVAGMNAKRRGQKAPRQGLFLGLIYGGFLGIGDAVYVPQGSAAVKLLQRAYPNASHAQIMAQVALLQTGADRFGSLITTLVIWGLLGLLFAWIGSLLGKKTESDGGMH